ncbi:MAG: cell envelope integrity protein TolA [Pseudoxanthomonas suwonensis]|nr:cell envelope integrity protein TolA [Pseudoxanthomonas suwonensis]
MRKRGSDNTFALLAAIGLHLLLFGLAIIGVWFSRAPTAAGSGTAVQADMVELGALSASTRAALAREPLPVEPDAIAEPLPDAPPEPEPEPVAAPPQPLPEPAPQDAVVPRQQQAQDIIPDPAPEQQEAARRDSTNPLTAEREAEARRRQEQIDLTERQRQQEAEQQRRLAAQREAEERQKAEREQRQRAEQLRRIQAERARARREAEQAEARLQQIADREAARAAASAAAGSGGGTAGGAGGGDANLRAQYAAAIQEAILRQWRRPDNIPQGQRCRIRIRQLPGGEVPNDGVTFEGSCPYDEQGKRSVEAAILRAQPLPYKGFESVFQRNLTLNFEARDR